MEYTHQYRKYRKSFDDEKKWHSTTKLLNSEDTYKKVSQMINLFGKIPRNKDEDNEKRKRKRKENSKCVKIRGMQID